MEKDPITDAGPRLPLSALPVPFRDYVWLESIDPEQDRRRFYRLQWQPTLWGERALVRVWGRLGTLGHMEVLHPAESDAAVALARALLRTRLRHGYVVTDWR